MRFHRGSATYECTPVGQNPDPALCIQFGIARNDGIAVQSQNKAEFSASRQLMPLGQVTPLYRMDKLVNQLQVDRCGGLPLDSDQTSVRYGNRTIHLVKKGISRCAGKI